MLLMRPSMVPKGAATARPRKKQAAETTRPALKADGNSLPPELADIADVIASADDDLPSDLGARKKHYLRLWGFGRDRSAQPRQQR